MTYSPVTVDSWGGLNVADDPQEVGFGRAVDSLNQDASERGRLRQRPGTAQFASSFSPDFFVSLVCPIPIGGDYEVLLSTRGPGTSGIYAYASNGAAIGSIDGSSRSAVVYGDPTYSAAYIAVEGDLMAKYEPAGGGTFTPDVVGVSADYVAIMPTENRLVAAKNSRVYFSGAGEPEALGGLFVDLDPGDGERFQGMVTWRDLVFVFKESKFFVFYGSGIGQSGDPEFNYTPVRASIGSGATINSVCATRDGVYFVSTDGVYRVTGASTPQKVSGALEPWFSQRSLPLATSLPTTYGRLSISADQRRVYLGLDEGSFVYHLDTQEWAYWDIDVSACGQAVVAGSDGIESIIGTESRALRLSAAMMDDDGDPISFRYRTGVNNLGFPSVKVVRQAQVWGSGTVDLSVFTDHGLVDAGVSSVTLGTAPTVARGLQMYSRQGTFFGFGIESEGPLVVHQATLDVRDQRPEGVG